MSNETQALLIQEPRAIERATPSGVASMLQTVIERGVTGENVAALESLVKLYERMQDRDAEQQFAAAFVRLQAEMPKVKANRTVPNNDGSARYAFAPFEDIMAQVAPHLQANGFTVAFDFPPANQTQGKLCCRCTLQHAAGHKRSNDFTVRIGSGPPKATETQADGAASTYAKRFALCNSLNIVVTGLDNDARAEGASITPDQAAELRKRVRDTGSDEALFLKFAGSKTYEEIPAGKYAVLDSSLRKKESTK